MTKDKIIALLVVLFTFSINIKAENIDSLINNANNLAKEGAYIHSIEIINSAKNICIKNNDQRRLVNTYIVLSNIYLKLSKFSESLENLLIAENIAKDNNLTELEAQVYNSLAVLYFEADDEEHIDDYIIKYEDYISRAYKIIKENNFKNNDIILNYGVMIYMYKSSADSTINFFIEEKKHIDTTDYVDLIYLNEYIGHVYKNIGNYKEALNYHFESLKYAKKDKNDNLIAMNYSNIAFSHLQLNELDSALFYAKKSLKLAEIANNKYALKQTLKILIDIYYNKKDIENYHKYNIKIDSIGEVYYSNKSTKEFIKLQFELNEEIKDIKIDLLEKENQLKNTKMRISIIIFSILALSLILVIILMKKREKYRKIINRQKLVFLEESEKQIKIENENLEDEIKLRSRELITKTMLIVKNKEVMESLSDKIIQLKPVTKKSNQKLIKNILSEIKTNSKDFWDDFFLYFNGIHSDFLEKLNSDFNSLTNTEKKICALIKLNLSTNDISKITSSSPRTIEKHRANIRKKIKIEKGEILSNFLKNL